MVTITLSHVHQTGVKKGHNTPHSRRSFCLRSLCSSSWADIVQLSCCFLNPSTPHVWNLRMLFSNKGIGAEPGTRSGPWREEKTVREVQSWKNFSHSGLGSSSCLCFLLLFSFVFIGGEKCFKLQLSFYRQTQVSNISATQYQVQRCCWSGVSFSLWPSVFGVSKSSKYRNKRTPVLVEVAVFKFCRVKCKNIECLLQLGRSWWWSPRLHVWVFSCFFLFFTLFLCPVCSNAGLTALPN